jgi:hypothetical protein
MKKRILTRIAAHGQQDTREPGLNLSVREIGQPTLAGLVPGNVGEAAAE